MADGGQAAQEPVSIEKPPLVRFEAVTKRFGSVVAVETLSLDIKHGEFSRCLARPAAARQPCYGRCRIQAPTQGRILLDGEDIVPVQPHRRPVNMMFQSYALFPHLSVEGNIGFGLRQENVARAEIADRIAEMLVLVRLQGFGGRRSINSPADSASEWRSRVR